MSAVGRPKARPQFPGTPREPPRSFLEIEGGSTGPAAKANFPVLNGTNPHPPTTHPKMGCPSASPLTKPIPDWVPVIIIIKIVAFGFRQGILRESSGNPQGILRESSGNQGAHNVRPAPVTQLQPIFVLQRPTPAVTWHCNGKPTDIGYH